MGISDDQITKLLTRMYYLEQKVEKLEREVKELKDADV
jgi:cell division protein FtsB